MRCFENDNITHVDGSINPVRDKEVIDIELQLKDLETIETRIERLEKQARHGTEPKVKKMYELAKRYKTVLEEGKSARTLKLYDEEAKLAKEFFLLTNKPVMYVCNVDETSAKTGNKFVEQVKEAVKDENAELLVIAAATEADIAELEEYEEKQLFLEELGLEEPGVNKMIHAAYNLLNLQTFFTTGPDESRAWTFRKGTKAPQAAGIIHTDFEKGFIRAEVIRYDEYVRLGSEHACREAGKIGVEGKAYVVQDGDIMHFRFNV